MLRKLDIVIETTVEEQKRREELKGELTERVVALYETVEKMVGGVKVVMDVYVQTENKGKRVGWIEVEVKR